MDKIKFTIFTKPNGIMTKEIKLVNGQIDKDSSQCWLSVGEAETVELLFKDLPISFLFIAKNQAVAWGISKYDKIKIVTQSQENSNPDAISRTAKHFDFLKGKPAAMMLDNDTGKSTAEFMAKNEQVMPELKGVARIERPSCSSDIYEGDKLLTNKETGRVDLLIDDGSQIPRIGKNLHKRLILAKCGKIQIARSGAMLVRSPVDACVWQPERLDFVAPPVLGEGLTRKAPKAKYIDGVPLVADDVKDLTPDEERQLAGIIAKLKVEAQEEADAVKAKYRGIEVDKLVKTIKIKKKDAEKIVEQRCIGNLIDGDMLHFDELGSVPVSDVLREPQNYHLMTLADPVEPEYGGGRNKAILYHNEDGSIIINSQAHGGRTFTLGAPKVSSDSGATMDETPLSKWPEMDSKAYIGFAGDFVRLATGSSEADPSAVLLTFLTRFGVEVGRGKTMAVGDTKHKPILASVIVGSSSKARKGTSARPVERLFSVPETLLMFAPWDMARSSKGPFSSGEGIIHAIRDKVLKWDAKEQAEVVVDPGVEDKRLSVLDEEFGGVLANTKREGNTLSMIIRQCWDGGTLDPLTKNNKIKATNGVVGWVSHITITELNLRLAESESFNGFANRILWCLARRQKLVPIPEEMPREKLEALQYRLLDILKASNHEGSITLGPEAKAAWRDHYYADLTKDRPGLAGCTTNRGEAQALRLAMIYCLLDSKKSISIDHLESGIAVWNYCRQSANYIFAGRQEDATAEQIIDALKTAPMTRTDLHRLFKNNVTRDKIKTSLQELMASKQIEESTKQGKKGAPTKIYHFIERPYEINEINELSQSQQIQADLFL